MTDGCDISNEIALRLTSRDLSDDKSTLVQVMAWCHQATSHYLNQCWPRYLPPYGVTRPQWVNLVTTAGATIRNCYKTSEITRWVNSTLTSEVTLITIIVPSRNPTMVTQRSQSWLSMNNSHPFLNKASKFDIKNPRSKSCMCSKIKVTSLTLGQGHCQGQNWWPHFRPSI